VISVRDGSTLHVVFINQEGQRWEAWHRIRRRPDVLPTGRFDICVTAF
jgi:hypothetical protein